MGPIGIPELVLIFIILLLIFGGKKIPELARGLGAGQFFHPFFLGNELVTAAQRHRKRLTDTICYNKREA